MEKMALLRLIGNIIIILALPVLLLAGSLAWGFNSPWLYNYGFDKYAVSESTGLSVTDLHRTTDALIEYFNSDQEYIEITVSSDGRSFELFTEEEKIHFRDVKQLVRLDLKVLYISLVVVVVLGFLSLVGDVRKNWRGLARTLINGSLLTIGLIVVIAVAAFFNFDNLFLSFHYLAFTNQFWSAGGYMLLLFPGGFWYDAAFICVGFMAVLALVIGLVSFGLLKWDQKRLFMTH